MLSARTKRLQKTYEAPAVTKLPSEKAKEFLLHHASLGDQGAQDLLDLVLPANEYSE
jgi:hypothetical protein